MQRIIVAPDSFKESLSASQVTQSISEGIKKTLPAAQVIQVPLSDGGEGLTESLIAAAGGQFIYCPVTGPLGERIQARYGILNDQCTAIIEMAAASGLPLVPRGERNPLITTTRGTGDLIRAALDAGCKKLIIGIGGSATNDGGAGMAQALGVKLLDDRGREISPGAQGLLSLSKIEMSDIDPRLTQTEVLVACDVENPLYGLNGAAYVYGPQKGARLDMLPLLNQALINLADTIVSDLQIQVHDVPGAGAAGGLGAGLMAFIGGKLCSGIQLVFEILGFEAILAAGADLVITGEGSINGQSLYGKVPVGVARLAKNYDLPVLAIVGHIGPGADKVYEAGIDAIMAMAPGPISLEESISRAEELLTDATSRALRIMNLGK
ncbi:glycerate kinase [hydrocarbon metagenome]|uniref:Glycerate kinase n=1 Tax=hydrocarbon metagenome TaxID=938273 RepID=A0A0W8E1G9_9ZZZZ